MKIEKLPEKKDGILDVIDQIIANQNLLIDAVNTLMEKEEDKDISREQFLKNLKKLAEISKHQEPEWPQLGDEYFNISADGEVISEIWEDTEFDRDVRDFLGIYKTEEEAEEAIKRIKELLNK